MGGATIQEHWLDKLGKAFATGVSRKQFIRMCGAILLGLVTPRAAEAQAPDDGTCQVPCSLAEPTRPDCCNGACTTLLRDVSNCGECGRRCETGQVCRPCAAGESCRAKCVQPDPPAPGLQCDPPCGPQQICVAVCQAQPEKDSCCCDKALACGQVCFRSPPNRNDEQGRPCCCRSDQTCCAGSCCDSGQRCMPDGSCCPNGSVCNDRCCQEPTGTCINGDCWPSCSQPCLSGQICIDRGSPESGIPPTCCSPELVWDTGPRIDGSRGLCCPPANRWLRSESGYGRVADCCPDQDRWQEGSQCCPPERRRDPRLECCPANTVAGVDQNDPQLQTCCQPSFFAGGVCCDIRAQPVGGRCVGGPPAQSLRVPWFDPNVACAERAPTTVYYNAVMGDCKGTLIICGDEVTIACPYPAYNLFVQEEGPLVCCAHWREAVRTKQPCDPILDTDCDGIPNDRDNDPFNPGSPPPRKPSG